MVTIECTFPVRNTVECMRVSIDARNGSLLTILYTNIHKSCFFAAELYFESDEKWKSKQTVNWSKQDVLLNTRAWDGICSILKKEIEYFLQICDWAVQRLHHFWNKMHFIMKVLSWFDGNNSKTWQNYEEKTNLEKAINKVTFWESVETNTPVVLL